MTGIQGDSAFRADAPYGTHDEQTYAGVLSFLRRRYSRDLAGVDVAVSGIPYDLGTSNRPGTRFGPAAIRAASAHLAWGPQWPFDFDPFDRLAVVDWGDHYFHHGYVEAMIEAVEAGTAAMLEAGCFTMTMGGDHFVALPLLRAHAGHHGGGISLVHFDAHTDTEASDKLSHGTMFHHAARDGLIDPARSIQLGIRTHNQNRCGFRIIDGWEVQRRGAADLAAEIRERVGDNRAYLSFDIDFLDPAYAPGTGTPVAGGPTTTQALDILRHLGGIDFRGMDLVEVAPAYDSAEVTALAGASLLYQMLHVLAADRPSRS